MKVRANRITKIQADIEHMQQRLAELQQKKKYLESIEKKMEGKTMRRKYAKYCSRVISSLVEADPRIRGRIDAFLQVLGNNIGLTILPFEPERASDRDKTDNATRKEAV